jgi:hypothetical protein
MSRSTAGLVGVLRVLDYMIEHGETEAAVRTIERFGRQIKVIQGQRTRQRKAH